MTTEQQPGASEPEPKSPETQDEAPGGGLKIARSSFNQRVSDDLIAWIASERRSAEPARSPYRARSPEERDALLQHVKDRVMNATPEEMARVEALQAAHRAKTKTDREPD